jgi:signal transduction histidine kinase
MADWALTLVMTALMLVTMRFQITPLNFLLMVPLAWRRRFPISVFLLIVAAAVIPAGQFGTPASGYVGITAIMIGAYSVGAYSRHTILSPLLLLVVALFIVTVVHGQLPPIPVAAGPFLVLLPLWLIGNALRTRQLRADSMEDRAVRLEREREAETRAAIAAEQSRMAREIHDVVAHSVSVMVVEAGAARQVLTSSPEEARDALLAVEASGREAMTELRNMLGVLRDSEAGPDLAPQPGLKYLEPLVQRVGEAGLPVHLRIDGTPRPLTPGIDLAAFRIVQEALTNCLKYSGMARTDVVLEYRDTELKLEVLDDGANENLGAGDRVGRGLLGMRERVALYGGTLEAGPRLERGYAVRAWLPVETPSA